MNATTDAACVLEGAKLGADSSTHERLDEMLRTAVEPVTVPQVEAVTRPDVRPGDYASRPSGGERLGMARLYAPPRDAPESGWGLAAAWAGWLPGAYVDREAALCAYGYLLAGEAPGSLETLRDHVQGTQRRLIAVEDIKALASGSLVT
ncbi:hypothetical protein [Streptomyces sp. enrichment culture]|uniref:hypothetical protein n=1 Tax=Streptomyces sp. enrichment culture TaxID=1795815 RepID=UPI003F577D4C